MRKYSDFKHEELYDGLSVLFRTGNIKSIKVDKGADIVECVVNDERKVEVPNPFSKLADAWFTLQECGETEVRLFRQFCFAKGMVGPTISYLLYNPYITEDSVRYIGDDLRSNYEDNYSECVACG